MISVGVIGYGHWGPQLVRNFAALDGVRVAMVADIDGARLATAARDYPAVLAITDPRDLIEDTGVDAVVLATPALTHFELGLQTLQAGKHLLVEKPLCPTVDQVQRLVDEARARELTLMVDHTAVFDPPVEKIRSIVSRDDFGAVVSYDAVRVNETVPERDVNVVFDLALHDLSLVDFILGQKLRDVSVVGISEVPRGLTSTAYVSMFGDKGTLVHIHAQWQGPQKIRRTVIKGKHKALVWDALSQAEKLKVFDRHGESSAPELEETEPLRLMARHFVDCVAHSKVPLTNGESALRITGVLARGGEQRDQ